MSTSACIELHLVLASARRRRWLLGLLGVPGHGHEVGIQPCQRRRQLRLALLTLRALQHELLSGRAFSHSPCRICISLRTYSMAEDAASRLHSRSLFLATSKSGDTQDSEACTCAGSQAQTPEIACLFVLLVARNNAARGIAHHAMCISEESKRLKAAGPQGLRAERSGTYLGSKVAAR